MSNNKSIEALFAALSSQPCPEGKAPKGVRFTLENRGTPDEVWKATMAGCDGALFWRDDVKAWGF
jgi:hypothetical protein